MKRYELAKKEGLPWEAVLVTDAETDLKYLIRDCVLRGDSLARVNDKVVSFIREVVKKLETESIKIKVSNSFPAFATKLYYNWVLVFGTQATAIALLSVFKAQKKAIPEQVEKSLKSVPKRRILASFEDAGAYNRATPMNIYNREYEKELHSRINKIADMTASNDYRSKYSLRAGVEIDLRYEANQKQIAKLRDDGVELAWIDTHANCSERCKPHQGKLYSLTGESGTIDGVKYEPLENATEIIDKYGYRNGCLSGFNCRHKLIPYKKGFRPIEIPEAVMKKQRELEKQQRYMERNVRRYESRALAYKMDNNNAMYKHYKQLAKKWTEEYEGFSRKNKIPFYPSRLDV